MEKEETKERKGRGLYLSFHLFVLLLWNYFAGEIRYVISLIKVCQKKSRIKQCPLISYYDVGGGEIVLIALIVS